MSAASEVHKVSAESAENVANPVLPVVLVAVLAALLHLQEVVRSGHSLNNSTSPHRAASGSTPATTHAS